MSTLKKITFILIVAIQTLQAGPYDQDFLQAIRDQDIHRMKSMLELGAHRDCMSKAGETPLGIALKNVINYESPKSINCLKALIVFAGINPHEVKKEKKAIPRHISSVIESALLDRQRLLLMYLKKERLLASKITPGKLYSFVADELEE